MAVVVLLDRMHQAHVAFLDEIKKVERAEAAILLCDRDHQPQMSLHHLLARALELAARAAHGQDGAAEFRDRQSDALDHCSELAAQDAHAVGMTARELAPSPVRCRGRTRNRGLEPIGIELMSEIALEHVAATETAVRGQPHQLLLDIAQDPLLALELRDQIGNPLGVQAKLVRLGEKAGKDRLPTGAAGLGKGHDRGPRQHCAFGSRRRSRRRAMPSGPGAHRCSPGGPPPGRSRRQLRHCRAPARG